MGVLLEHWNIEELFGWKIKLLFSIMPRHLLLLTIVTSMATTAMGAELNGLVDFQGNATLQARQGAGCVSIEFGGCNPSIPGSDCCSGLQCVNQVNGYGHCAGGCRNLGGDCDPWNNKRRCCGGLKCIASFRCPPLVGACCFRDTTCSQQTDSCRTNADCCSGLRCTSGLYCV